MNSPHLLGIDIGTSATKALICDHRGRLLATASAPHRLLSPKPGWSEQHPEDWWKAVGLATRSALKKSKIRPDTIKGIGLSGQMHGSVFLADGPEVKPLRPALLWNDQRTAEQCSQIESAAGGRAALIELVANPALTGFTAPKILWVRQNEPKIYEKTKHILLPKDFIRLRLTGEYATDVSDASGTLLLDVISRSWSLKLLDLLQIDPSLLPRLYESPEITGTLTKPGAAHLGLPPGIPVVGGGGDQAAGAVGNGIVQPGIVSAALGTSGVVFAHSDVPCRDPHGRVHTMCHAVPGKWCVFGCMLSAGGSFQWLRENILPDSYDALIAQAKKSPPGCEGLIFLPYLTGERCPYPDPAARGAWIGLTNRTTRPMLIRSLLEGVTFGMADALKIMQEMKIPVSEIRASGGGAQSPFWRQLQADIYSKTVVTTNAPEGPAYGAALLAGVGTGIFPSVEAACAIAIRRKLTIQPNPPRAAFYEKVHAEYRNLYPALKAQFAALGALTV